MKAVLIFAVVLIGALAAFWTVRPYPYTQEKLALSKVHLLKPGMKEREVWKTLGMESYGLYATPENHSRFIWTPAYPLTPEKMLWTRWKIEGTSNILLAAEIRPNNFGSTIRERRAQGKLQ